MTDSGGPPVAAEEQLRLLDDALLVVRQQTSLMRRCLETPGKLMDALKCSSTLVAELRTSSLGPKQYYELYMAVFDALRHLTIFLRDAHPATHLADLYELVQYAGNIVPRLYLMITVGTVYMSVEDAPVKEIMKDMMEMSRGVQHPVRGLFLRYYLSGQARDALPTGSGDGFEGNLNDSITFILTNFVEMNKLWVRLQHQGHSRERELRIKERQELQLLVGSNLVRLSQLVTLEMYQDMILQPLLQQVVACRDILAQEYLLEVITQVFPDEYHLKTLDQLLATIAQLHPQVNVKSIVVGLMDRLSAHATQADISTSDATRQRMEEEAVIRLLESTYISERPDNSTGVKPKDADNSQAQENGEDTEIVKQQTDADAQAASDTKTDSVPTKKGRLFDVFFTQVQNLVQAQRLHIQHTIALLVSLTKLALNTYPDDLEYVDRIFAYAADKVHEYTNSADLHAQSTQASILALLRAPIQVYRNLFTSLALPHFAPLFRSQAYAIRRAVAGDIITRILYDQTKISTLDHLEKILGIIRVLIVEGSTQLVGHSGISSQRRGDSEDVVLEQGLLARLIHYLQADDNDTQFKMLQMVKSAFFEGKERIKYTTSPLVTASLRLARRYKSREHFDDNWSSQSTALYKFLHSTISGLYSRIGAAELCLRLFVASGQVADQNGFETIAYEFFAQAFTIYEEAISDSRAQFQAVCVIASALYDANGFTRENYDTLITKAALHGSKLLKKPDQCRAVYLASHLWWAVDRSESGEEEGQEQDGTKLYRDGKRVLECLQRALKVADACMDTSVSVGLFVEILNRYVYYFDQQNETVTTKYLNGLIELIHSNIQSNQENTSLESPKAHFQRTLEYIQSREYEGVNTEAKT